MFGGMIDRNVDRYFEPGWVVYVKTETQDGYGGLVVSYTSSSVVEGRMRPLSGDKRLSADKVDAFATHRFYCRPTAAIVPGVALGQGSADYVVKFAADVMTQDRLMQVDVELVKP